MKVKPTNNRVLIQLIPNELSNVILPQGVDVPLQKWKVLEVSEETKCCVRGDTILILPDARILGIDDFERIGLTSDNSVIAIVED